MKNEDTDPKHYPNLALSILTAKDENPIGVIIPLTDWKKLKPSLQPESPLYKLMQSLAAEMANTNQLLLKTKMKTKNRTAPKKYSYAIRMSYVLKIICLSRNMRIRKS